MTDPVFAGPRRWIAYLALVLAFSVACGLLSWWQFARNEEAQERIRQIEENWDAAPVDLGALLASPAALLDPADTWTPSALHGEYLVDETLLVRGRPRDGRPGFQVLVPLRLDDGSVLVVDRGWVPVGAEQDLPDLVPAPQPGPQRVIVRLKAGEPGVPGRTAADGQVATIELPLVAEILGMPRVYTGAYGVLDAEPDSTISAAPLRADRPAPDPGPHLSYAIQWILFAIGACAALAWAVRHEIRVRRGLSPARRPRRVDQDAAAEDAILDERRQASDTRSA